MFILGPQCCDLNYFYLCYSKLRDLKCRLFFLQQSILKCWSCSCVKDVDFYFHGGWRRCYLNKHSVGSFAPTRLFA